MSHTRSSSDTTWREHDRGPGLGNPGHERRHHVPPGDRVQAGDRLVVQQQHAGQLGERQRVPGPAAARQLPGRAGQRDGKVTERGPRGVERGVQRLAQPQVVRDGEPLVQRVLLALNATLDSARGLPEGWPSTRTVPSVAGTHQGQEGRLARAVRADEGDDAPFGQRQRAVPQRPRLPVALPPRWPPPPRRSCRIPAHLPYPRSRHALRRVGLVKGVVEQRGQVVAGQAAGLRGGDPVGQVAGEPGRDGRPPGGRGQVRDEGARPCRVSTRCLVSIFRG